ncbi:hypothetical protein ACLBOM_22265 [Escherichia coli]
MGIKVQRLSLWMINTVLYCYHNNHHANTIKLIFEM